MTRRRLARPKGFNPCAAGPTAIGAQPICRSSRRGLTTRDLAIGLVLSCLVFIDSFLSAAGAAPESSRRLRVVTTPTAPFVLPDTEPLSGFSIDIWNELARRMGADFTWKVVPRDDLLSAVERGEADVAISAITMTPERDKRVDFSHPYFDGGLQIMVRSESKGRLMDAIRSLPWRFAAELLGAVILILFVLGNVVWLVERRRNPIYQNGYLRSLGEGLWGSTLIIATGEYGDSEAAGVIKRITVGAMWLLGVVLVALFTASVTSSQTVARLRSDIRGPDDLPGKKIGTVPGSIAAEYLTKLGLPYVGITDADAGFRMLTNGDIQAVVFDAPTLQYWVAKRGAGIAQVVGPVFRPEKYGIVVCEGSPLRKPVNEALLRIYTDGTYERLYQKWFTHGK